MLILKARWACSGPVPSWASDNARTTFATSRYLKPTFMPNVDISALEIAKGPGNIIEKRNNTEDGKH